MSLSHDHGDVEPVTDRTHENSWSANLEGPEHGDDVQLVIDHAVDAVEHTAPGYHVNLVTHADHGHPADYLYEALEELATTRDIDWEYVDQCGCGGHVTRVHVG